MQKLSTTLRNIRDTFHGHAVVDGQIIIDREGLDQLVEALDLATQAAEALERELEAARRTSPVSCVQPMRPVATRDRLMRRQPGWRPVEPRPRLVIIRGRDDEGGQP